MELQGHFQGAYGTVDMAQGVVDFDVPDAVGSVAAINELSRVAARWICVAALHDVSVGESMAWAVETWASVQGVKEFDYYERLVTTPAQQAAYASGLIANLAATTKLRELLAESGRSFSGAKFNRWRITDGAHYIGNGVMEAALATVDTFAA